MNVRITRSIRGGAVRAIASKSGAHRLLICAALADGDTFIICPERSEDIDATARCLQTLGVVARYERDGFAVTPVSGREAKQYAPGAAARYGRDGFAVTPVSGLGAKRYALDCGESGSTFRFMLPVCGALGVRAAFYLGGRLPERPMSPLYDEMASHGCTLSEPGISPLVCDGQLTSGNYTLPGNISSQFISGLLFALPILSGDSVIRVTGVLESRPYVDMTLDALRLFGITVMEEEGRVFRVPGGQIYRSPHEITVEGDWSNAAFWLSAGAIGKGAVICKGLNMNSRQGDRAVAGFLERFGASVVCVGDTVTVSPGKLHGIDIDAGDTPDLVPVLAAVAAVAQGKTVIRNAGRLRLKESDRLRAVAASLSGLGADITETEDGLAVIGKNQLAGGQTESFGDHRIAMAAVVVSAACEAPVEIRGAEAVNKSYPGFFNDFDAYLGGEWEVY